MEKTIKHTPAAYSDNLRLFREKSGIAELALEPLSQWEFCTTGKTNSLNLKEKGKENYIHYPDNIEEELEYWSNQINITNANALVVYGLGIGYYFYVIKDLLEKSPTRRLIFIEDDPQILRAFLETDCANEILKHPQVDFIFLLHERFLPSLLETKFSFPGFQGAFFSALLYYAKVRNAECGKLNFYVSLVGTMRLKQIGEQGQGGTPFFKNYFSNFLDLHDAIYGPSLYKRFKGIPAIICGAGPSLEKNIDQLEKLKDKALIFAGGTAMNALNAQGVLPHFGVGIDPFETQISRIMENNAFLIPYFVNLRMNKEALNAILGDKIYLPTDAYNGYPLAMKLEKEIGIPEPEPINTGHNVINFSMAIAQKLGCNPILCVGLDLAYTGGKSYAPKVQVHGTFDPRKALVSKSPMDEVITATDIYGKPVQTLYHWLVESNWYGAFKNQNPDLQIYNCTEGGIGLSQIENIPLKEAAERFLKNDMHLKEKIAQELKEAKARPLPEKSMARSALQSFSNELYLFLSEIKKLDPQEKKERIDKEIASESKIASYLCSYGDIVEEDKKYTYLESILVNLELVLFTALMNDIAVISQVEQPQAPEGQQVCYYDDGKTIQAVLPRGSDNLEGTFLYYYKTGHLKRSIEYHHNVRSGWDRYYSERGILLREIEYEAGLPKGIGRVFDNEGKLQNEIRYSSPGVVSEFLRLDKNDELVPDINFEGGYAKYAIEKSDQVQALLSKLGKAVTLIKKSPDESVNQLNDELVELEKLLSEMKELGGMDASRYKEALWGSKQVFTEIAKQFEGLSKDLGFKTEKLQEALKKLLEKQNDGKI